MAIQLGTSGNDTIYNQLGGSGVGGDTVTAVMTLVGITNVDQTFFK